MDTSTRVVLDRAVVRTVTYTPLGTLVTRVHLSVMDTGREVTIRDMSPGDLEDLGMWLVERAVIARMPDMQTAAAARHSEYVRGHNHPGGDESDA